MTAAWTGDWPQRFRSIVRKMGHEDTFAFVIAYPGKSFGELFGLIRKNASETEARQIALAYLEELFYVDAAQRRKLRVAVIEALVRSFCQFMATGWNTGKKIAQRRIDVRSKWPVPHLISGLELKHADWRKFQDLVMESIEQHLPPDNWCPKNWEDSILSAVFLLIWPIGQNKPLF